jgi:hypothetical protein
VLQTKQAWRPNLRLGFLDITTRSHEIFAKPPIRHKEKMKSLYALIVFFVMSLSSGVGIAQDFDDAPLARCPSYEKNSPAISQIGWAVTCLLTALHNGDKEIIAILSPASRCDRAPKYCDGPLDRHTSESLFGLEASSKVTGDAASTWLKKRKSFLVSFYDQPEGRIEVRIISRPGKESVIVRDGLYRDFYATDFIFDPEIGMWRVDGMLFYFETDSYQMANGDSPVDLTGRHSVLPSFIWKAPQSR